MKEYIKNLKKTEQVIIYLDNLPQYQPVELKKKIFLDNFS